MVMSGIGWKAVPSFADYELSVYDMSTHKKIDRIWAILDEKPRSPLPHREMLPFLMGWTWY
jgi:hypothetical protein